MKKTTNTVRALSVVLSLLMVLSVISFPTLKAKADGTGGTLDDFVERCYTVTLDRPSDADGFADWKGQLLNGKAVGFEIAYGFLFSKEYLAKDKDNDEYLHDLYMLFMGREPDENGYNDWMGKLNGGASRLEVFAGFANSPEFYLLCKDYGITAGRYTIGYDRQTNNNVNLFVERLYKVCLGRIGDKDGQANWVNKLITKQITGSECARSFIQSPEYVNKGLYDENYVENLYLAMFGRPSDESGKENWMTGIKNGMTRDEVFAGFANSQEFANLCAKYNIDKGSYTAKDIGNPNNVTTEKKFRNTRIDYSNGDYVLLAYNSDNDVISEKRYDKNGNILGYDYRYETVGNDEYWCQKYYTNEGTYIDGEFRKDSYNADKTQRTTYYYTDEWCTVSDYDVYEEEQFTYTSDTVSVTSTHPLKGTFYDENGDIAGSVVYEYYPDNREKCMKQYLASGTLYYSDEYEYYDKKGGIWEFIKTRTVTDYNSDGTAASKTVEEYNEHGSMVKSTTYIDGALSEYEISEYNSNNTLTKSVRYTADNKEIDSQINSFDTYGRLIKSTFYKEGVYNGYSEHTWDDNNNLLKYISFRADNTVISHYEYKYDQNGNETYIVEYDGEDTFEETMEYDANNNMIKETRFKNGTEYLWVKYTYEEYTE